MRRSEAQVLLQYLVDNYQGPLSLEVVNLNSLGFNLPSSEHPYFVVGREEDGEDTTGEDVLQQQHEVVVWDQTSSGWSVRHVRRWEIDRAGSAGRELYIYDTRNGEFVPPEKFHIPEDPI